MPPEYDLAFCIPTYNFGSFIGETLDSIIHQADDKIQIVIVDGGSSDDTAAVVASRAVEFPGIKFIQRATRSGVDRDILESVDQAEAPYCWLFSSDDLLAPGAIEFLRSQLALKWDVLVTNFAVCDRQMNRLFRHRILKSDTNVTFDWRVQGERDRYFQRAETTTAFFSFISSLVVRREVWLRPGPQHEFVGSCWIIAAQLFAAAREGIAVRYHPGELLSKRSDNDSFLSRGWVKRLALGIDGFRKVAEHYFGPRSAEAREISRVLKNETPIRELVRSRLKISNSAEQAEFDALVRRQYSDGTVADFLKRSVALSPVGLLRNLRSVQCGARSIVRAARGLPRTGHD